MLTSCLHSIKICSLTGMHSFQHGRWSNCIICLFISQADIFLVRFPGESISIVLVYLLIWHPLMKCLSLPLISGCDFLIIEWIIYMHLFHGNHAFGGLSVRFLPFFCNGGAVCRTFARRIIMNRLNADDVLQLYVTTAAHNPHLIKRDGKRIIHIAYRCWQYWYHAIRSSEAEDRSGITT